MKKILSAVAAALSAALVALYICEGNIPSLFDRTLMISAVSVAPSAELLGRLFFFEKTAEPEDPPTETPPPADPPAEPLPETAAGRITYEHFDQSSADYSAGGILLRNHTSLDLDFAAEAARPLGIVFAKTAEPEILIVHTHTCESYMGGERDFYTADDASRSTDPAEGVAAVGEAVAKELTAAGFSVIHDTTVHDSPVYTGSYTRAAATIKAQLAAHPSIKIVIDLHRDAIASSDGGKVAPVADINGQRAAQVMLCIGSETEDITDFPNWRENLSLALKVEQALETGFPGLTRPANFGPYKYNMDICPGSMLIEVGSDANSLNQALCSGELVGRALASLFSGMTE